MCRLLQHAVATLAVLLASATPVLAQARACTTLLQNAFVRNTMEDVYLWYRELPDADPAAFGSPEAYLDAIRYRRLDQSFSYITSAKANVAFYSASQFVGFGFSSVATAAGVRITEVFPGSPADRAGLQRGDRITQIDGRSVESLAASDDLAGAFGPAELGVTREIVFSHETTPVRARITKEVVTIPTLSMTRMFDVDGRKVGYIVFRNFVEPSVEALDAAFGQLRATGVTELVLDLRYNGGGLVSVAQHLASLIGGSYTAGQVFARFTHNDRNSQRDQTLRFESPNNALSLARVVVITTRASASASELVVNSLRPFIPVIVVGDRTYGKPVGQYGFTMCQKVLYPVSFSTTNADGHGDYFDGIAPTCRADDDIEHALGDSQEGSLREALTVIRTGSCSGPATAGTLSLRPRSTPRAADGWSELIGAH
jgi:carboxyl-terminal processing protease